MSYGEGNIPDYAEAFEKFKAFHDQMNHNQGGDPARLGAVLMQLAEEKAPPVRFAAGSDAVGWVIDKAAALRAEAEKWRTLSAATDGQAGTLAAPDVLGPPR